jgi:hypothetical protein
VRVVEMMFGDRKPDFSRKPTPVSLCSLQILDTGPRGKKKEVKEEVEGSARCDVTSRERKRQVSKENRSLETRRTISIR